MYRYISLFGLSAGLLTNFKALIPFLSQRAWNIRFFIYICILNSSKQVNDLESMVPTVISLIGDRDS